MHSPSPKARPTSSPAPTSAPLAHCDLSELEIGAEYQGGTGSIIFDVALSSGQQLNGAELPCRIDTQVAVTLEDANQRSLNVVGNGQTVHAIGDLTSHALLPAWVWTNWCGPETEAVRFRVSIGGGLTYHDSELRIRARCDDSSQPSTLTAVAN